MKINFIILALMLGSFCASAQTTITRSDYQPVDGETYSYYATNTSISEGNGGANVTWDFSNLPTGSIFNFAVTSCNGNGDCAAYAGSSYYVSMQGSTGKGVFSVNDATGEQITGWENGLSSNYIYSDPQRILKFPVVYLDTFNDTISYHLEGYNLPDGISKGINNAIVDGYGTLKTPNATYNNVLRCKYVIDVVLTATSTHDQQENYFWFQAGISHPVMKMYRRSNNTDNSFWYTTSSPKNTGVTPINDVSSNTSINIFPNPARGFFKIKFESQEVNNISVKDLLGKTIFSQKINPTDNRNNTIDVNTSGWAKGIYLVEAAAASGSLVKKVVID